MKNIPKKILFPLLLIIILIISGFLYRQYTIQKSSDLTSTAESGDYVNLDPPSETEKQANNAQKDQIVTDTTEQTTPQGGLKAVSPVISTWSGVVADSVEISGFVPDIVETGGECKLIVSNGASEVTLTSAARADAQSTICGTLKYDAKTLGTTNLTMQLYYSSTTSAGSSDKVKLEL